MPFLSPPQDHTIILRDAASGHWLALTDPERIVVAHTPAEVPGCLREIETSVDRQGLTGAGFLSYEAAPAFDPALTVQKDGSGFPLLWFGLYRQAHPAELPCPAGPPPELAWQPSIDQAAYAQRLRRIHRYIASGDTYQVNFSYRLRSPFHGSAWPLFVALATGHEPEFGAYLQFGRWSVISLSPEVFFRLDGQRITSIPMKGTMARGLNADDDQAQGHRLAASPKDRAENLMIVDMVRNDLARIAHPGSVRVERLCAVQRHPTLWQMISPVTALTDAFPSDLLAALFPAASITGAPKARTMAIIAELETGPRRIYTGTIGMLRPGRRAQFNVAIRTLLIDQDRQLAEYGVGGGIVADSSIRAEWEETRIKSLACRPPRPPFDLLETLLWIPQSGYVLLEEHLRRLAASADYFAYRCDLAEIREQLADAAVEFGGEQRKVRLLLGKKGNLRIETGPPPAAPGRPVRLALAAQPIDPDNVFLYHKTTWRLPYAQARSGMPPWADDVILCNSRGEVTETTIANIVCTIDGRDVTPPVRCGLLPGTFRAHLLAAGCLEERIVTVDQVRRGVPITLINAVRGRYPAVLVANPAVPAPESVR